MSYDIQTNYYNIGDLRGVQSQQRRRLEHGGIEVLDSELIRAPSATDHSYYVDRIPYTPTDHTVRHTEAFDISWTLRMNLEQVDHLLRQDQELKGYAEELKLKNLEIHFLDSKVRKYEKAQKNLNNVLSEYPWAKEQWEEMLTMLKLAGFWDKLN
jgi:hypothetical protein